ncbi:MAG TPA: MFS transporter [Caulobacteraceae bacterium]|jgi:ACS family tartrate transporter-like MFS transporter
MSSDGPVGSLKEGSTAVATLPLSKLSWRLLPLVGIGYCLAYVDRVNISFAALQMNADLKFSATAYGTGAGLFFLSYAAFEIPSNLLMVRVGPRRWLARIMVTWGVIAAAMMFVRTPVQFYALRFLLGLAEAGFFPGVIYYLTLWFPSAYRARAISRFYVAAPLASVFMGALAGSLLGMKGVLGLAGWQWLFLVEGLPAVAVGLLFLWLLPDHPASTAWLSAAEKKALQDALAADAAAFAHAEKPTLARAIFNLPVLMLGAVNVFVLGLFYAINFSAPLMIRAATHWSAGQIGSLVAACGVVGAVCMLISGWSSDRAGERLLHLALPLFGVAAALAALAWIPNSTVLVLSFLAFFALYYIVQGVFWAASDRLLPPSYTPVAIAAINTIGMIGSFVAPILWGWAKDVSGSYDLGLKLLPVGFVLAGLIVLALRRAVRPKGSSALSLGAVAEEV